MREAIYRLVIYYLRFFVRVTLFLHKPTVVGITGSVGKTSTHNAVYLMLKDHFPTKMVKKGNSEIGIPLGILGLPIGTNSFWDWLRILFFTPFRLNYLRKTQYLVVEMGVDEPNPPKNMEYLLTIVQPQICILLNVHPVHTMQFEQAIPNILENSKLSAKEKMDLILKRIAEEKGKIFTHNPKCKTVIFNADNSYASDVVNIYKNSLTTPDKQFFSFGEKEDNDISFKGFDINLGGSIFDFQLKDNNKKISLKFKHYLMPEVYEETFAAAILVGLSVGLTTQQITKSLVDNYELPEGRSSLLEGIKNSTIIDSSYNASKRPVLAFLSLLEKLKLEEKRPTVFLFGDMRELGGRAETEHKEVAEHMPGVVDYLYCVGPLTQKYVVPRLERYLREVKWFKDSKTAGQYLKDHLPEKALVLVKGSQNTIFLEEAISFILKNPEDVKKLCRQDEFWQKKKLKFFSSV